MLRLERAIASLAESASRLPPVVPGSAAIGSEATKDAEEELSDARGLPVTGSFAVAQDGAKNPGTRTDQPLASRLFRKP